MVTTAVMEMDHLSLYSIVLSILICYSGIHRADANSIQHRSCDVVRCPAGSYCVKGQCCTSCDGVDCGPGEECTLQEVKCFTTPCNPIPTCKPIDICKMVRCSAGFTCIKGRCVKDPTCEGVICGPGKTCQLVQVQCFTAPCPPIPICKPDRCAMVRCPSGYECFNGKCVKVPTCKGVICKPGQKCELVQVQCFTAPCPPIPTCKPDRCAMVRCQCGYKCFNGRCVKLPTCEGYNKCEKHEVCYLKKVECVKEPCLPVPACRPKLTCATVNCIAGTVCMDNNGTPTCEPDRCATVRCSSGYKCFNGKCVKLPTCEGYNKCKKHEVCYLKKVQCVKEPCLPVLACRPKLTCATVNCIAGTVCVDNNGTPTCEPDRCATVRCSSGYKCFNGKCVKVPTCEG